MQQMKKFHFILLKPTIENLDNTQVNEVKDENQSISENIEILLNSLNNKITSKFNCDIHIDIIADNFDFINLTEYFKIVKETHDDIYGIFLIDMMSYFSKDYASKNVSNFLNIHKVYFDFYYIKVVCEKNTIVENTLSLDFNTKTFKNSYLLILPFDLKESIRIETFILCNINNAIDIQSNKNNFKLERYNLLNFKNISEQLKFYNKLFDTIKDSVVITEATLIDLPGPRIVYVNKAFIDMTGYNADEVIGLSPRKLQGPLSNRTELDRVRKALENWESVEVELINYKKNGSPFWVNFIIIPLADESGNYTHWISIQREITIRKATEELIKSSEEKFRLLFDNVLNGMIIQDSMGNILLSNNFAQDVFGDHIILLKGNVKNNILIDLNEKPIELDDYPINIIKRNKEKINNYKIGYKKFNNSKYNSDNKSNNLNIEINNNAFDNQDASATSSANTPTITFTKWLSLTTIPLLNEQNEIQYIITSFEDITSEGAVRLELDKLSLVASKTINAVIITDADGYIEWSNDGFTRITGYSFEESKGKKPGLLLQGKETNPETILTIRNNLKKLEPFTTEILNYSKNGVTYWVKLDISPIFDTNGKLTNYIAIETDITERKLYEEKLMTALEIAEEFRKLFDISTDLVSILDFNMYIVKFNPSWINILGYSESEIYTNQIYQFIHLEDRHFYTDIAIKLRSDITEINNLETRFLTKSGKVLWFSSNIKVDYLSQHLYTVTRNITQQKEVEFHIRKANNDLQNYKNALDASALISITDKIGLIQFANEKFVETSQYSLEELIGHNHRIVKSGFHNREFFKDMWGVILKGSFWRGEIKNKAKDGSFYWVDTVINPIKNENDEIVQFLAIRYLITERKKVEYELLIAKEDAERANTAKSEFLANMSHEIRTPMNAILGFSELIKNFVNNKLAVEYLNGIVSSGKNLLNLINDILDLSKIESGKIDIKLEAVNFRSLIEEVKQIFFYSSKQKQLSLSFEIDSQIPEYLYIDETRFRQVLLNLVGNAIKFTNSGYVKVEIKLDNENETQIKFEIDNLNQNEAYINLVITVEDSGIGIPEDQQIKIFEAFVQREGQSSRKYGGTGLGLTITKRLVEIMKGSIKLESILDEGSKFIISLPNIQVDKSNLNFKESNDVDINNIKFYNQKVLIVEDIATNRTIINGYLSPHNLNIIEAKNGIEALSIFKSIKPDLIIMDIQMPLLNGYETIKVIRELEGEISDKNIPIIIISANTNINYNINKLYNIEYAFIKPILKLDLIKELCKLLDYEILNISKNNEIDNSYNLSLENFIYRINSEISQNLRIEITELFYDKWSEITNKMLVNEIILFADETLDYGNMNNLLVLIDFGNKIKEEAEMFKIDSLYGSLKMFENIFIRINS